MSYRSRTLNRLARSLGQQTENKVRDVIYSTGIIDRWLNSRFRYYRPVDHMC